MLEEALRRGGEGFAGRMAPPPRSGNATPQPADPSSGLMMSPPSVNRATAGAPATAPQPAAESIEARPPTVATVPAASISPRSQPVAVVPPSGVSKEPAAPLE